MQHRSIWSLLASVICLAACGGQTTSNPVGQTSDPDAGRASDPDAGGAVIHLPSGLPSTCSLPRAPGSFHTTADAGAVPGVDCVQDTDCTAGKNGRCGYRGGNGSNMTGVCTYDQCADVSGCGSGQACVCRTADTTAAANTCIVADCTSDSQCAAGLCVQSIDRSSCDRPISYHCTTQADECGQDSDCTEQHFGSCEFSAMKGHFACNYSICSG